MAWFKFVKRRAPSPGAMGYALSEFRLSQCSTVGPGIVPMGSRSVWQPPQSVQNQFVPVAGLGGVTQGQLVGQPLFDLGTDGVASGDAF